MRVSRWLAAAVVWLLAVAVVAAVAWFAIATAGREVAGADHVMTLVRAVQPSPALPTTLANVAPATSPSSTPGAAPSTTLGAPPPESGTKAGTPSGTPSVQGPGGGGTGSYSSAGGVVIVRCVGGTAAASAMRVADGWRLGAAPKAGSRLRVLFVSGDGRTAGVEAGCQNGQPLFSPVG